jgi:hypothetical protein
MPAITASAVPTLRPAALALAFLLFTLAPVALAGPKPETFWQVDDVRPGMKGYGKTVMKGTKIEKFDAEVLGVLKNTSPGRDLVLCRLAGLDLERTGTIAGMSGSPVYIDGKLLGAVAYAWAYGKDPICGVTPFVQMHGYVEAFERRDLAEPARSRRVGLRDPIRIDGVSYDTVTVSQGHDDPTPTSADGLWLAPLRTPVTATRMTSHSLRLLGNHFKGGLVPVQGGGTTAKIADEEKAVGIEAGGSLSVALIQGDFDLSGIGTVTHVEGDRVYGWGHPFMSMGGCDLPLMTGYVHTVYPRQTVSFKMGSPLRNVGVINADVSTCIAGWLGKKPDLLPIRMTVRRDEGAVTQTFNVQTVRQKNLLPSLVFTALTNSVDMEGDLPDEMTAVLNVRVEVEGYDPIVIRDVFSGSSVAGGRAPQSLYGQVASLVGLLTTTTLEPLRITRIDAETEIQSGRRSAEIEAVEAVNDVCAPGETFRANVFIRPYKGVPQRVPVAMKLPEDLPEGSYSVQITDDVTAARLDLRDNPTMTNPQTTRQLFDALKVQTAAKRTNLVARLPVPGSGVAVDGKAMPDLPGSMVAILGGSRKSGAQTMSRSVVSRRPTDWVVLGSESVRIVVTKNKKLVEFAGAER